MHEFPSQPGFFRSFLTAVAIGGLVYGAYRVNGEMQPVLTTWHEIVKDFEENSDMSFYYTEQNYSLDVGVASSTCLEGTGAGVTRVRPNLEQQEYDLYVRKAGGVALDLASIQSCVVKTVGAPITVKVIPVG